MNLNSLDLLAPILRRWRVVLAAMVVCVAASVAVVLLETPQYRSTAQLFVSTQGSAATADAITNAYEGSQFTTARVQSYVELASSPEILQPVIAKLSLDMTSHQLASEVSASAPPNTVLINLSVTDRNAIRARKIATELAHQYIVLINKLESEPGHAAPVRVSISSPASFSSAPVSPKKSLDVGLGIILGLLIGVGAAQLLDRLDDAISSEHELNQGFDLRVLARVPFDPNASGGIAALARNTAVGRLEAVRGLRTALRYLNVDNPPKCIVVTSCDPGAGKSVTATTLAAVVADAGNDVVVVEGDLRRPRLREYMGTVRAADGVAEILSEGRVPAEVAVGINREWAAPDAGRLELIPAGTTVPNPSELVGSNRMRSLVGELRTSYDTVVVDAPPLLPVTDAALLATMADGVILVVEYGRTTRHNLRHALDSLEQVGVHVFGAVVNKTTAGGGYGYGYGYGYSYEPDQTVDGNGSSPASSTTDASVAG